MKTIIEIERIKDIRAISAGLYRGEIKPIEREELHELCNLALANVEKKIGNVLLDRLENAARNWAKDEFFAGKNTGGPADALQLVRSRAEFDAAMIAVRAANQGDAS